MSAAPEQASGTTPVIAAVGVSQEYKLARTRLLGPRGRLDALTDVDFHAMPGEAIGLVGESGSGKSTLTRILVGQEAPTAGVMQHRGQDIWTADREARRDFRRSVQLVLQNPRSSLDPRMKVGASLVQPLRSLAIDVDHGARVKEVLDQVGLGTDALAKYPHEFSGGQLQRIAIARALMPHPKVVIADEPVSALDVSIQAQVLNLLKDLVAELGLTLVLIAHDLSVVAYTTSRVAVMSGGRIVETGSPMDLFTRPEAEATQALVDAVLTVEGGLAGRSLT
ncbi:ATP-binding cassette domain-containing protein [Nocardioides sp. zg-579]|uniref:ATP-binding cassette domain-containing protein n=1 Tax=Nocardioides marmotae TaxID=2663857 RepID=A0A6I3J7Y6_9ACTN|nr:ATP-binding cassette domain-containing protein [Nocardioides marmotae]MCR6030735.1 ATP-binding cassette domain-containing protein [Gordonia jinghuaiqii]MTB94369.1 ATP-binding cassette domain-containing protein [Nocardioides marmotae]QKE01605.1 ABC transporter ATP-binding protein [Nocardioides marmotae]